MVNQNGFVREKKVAFEFCSWEDYEQIAILIAKTDIAYIYPGRDTLIVAKKNKKQVEQIIKKARIQYEILPVGSITECDPEDAKRLRREQLFGVRS